uniref:SPK domain-containing protein n=1 Tax=Panagrolaimus sp. ES5 TaxID=591445 RepID=A0AC34F739_9BILA
MDYVDDYLPYIPRTKSSSEAPNDKSVSCDSSLANQIFYIDYKYTFLEAQLRILSCCRDLGISTKNEIKYTDVQKAYKLKFDIALDKNEMKNLFGYSKAISALKNGVEDFIDIVNADNVIKLRLKHGSDEYITKMEEEFDGKTMPQLTNKNVPQISDPVPYEWKPSRHPCELPSNERSQSNFNNPRDKAFPITKMEKQFDGKIMHQFTNRNVPEISDPVLDEPHFSGPPPHPGYRIITPRIRNRRAQQNIDPQQGVNLNVDREKKDVEREKIQKFLNKLTEKMRDGRHLWEECKVKSNEEIYKEMELMLNILMESNEEIYKEMESMLNILMEVYYDKLIKLEKSVMEENKDLVRNLLKLRE